MAEKKKAAWRQSFIMWSEGVSTQTETLARHMESIEKGLQNEVYPAPALRNAQGEYNLSLIAETALLRCARDLDKIDPQKWVEYGGVYRQLYSSAGEKHIHLSNEAENAVQRIANRLIELGVRDLNPTFGSRTRINAEGVKVPKLNVKMITSLAISYCLDLIKK